MRTRTWALATIVLLAIFAFGASQATTPEDVSVGDSDTEGAAQSDATPVPIDELSINADELASGAGVHFEPQISSSQLQTPTNAFREELRVLLEEEALEIERLQALIAMENDPMGRVALERQVAERKQSTELSILQIQVKRARTTGREAEAIELEKSIREMLESVSVVPKSAPSERRRGGQ